MSSKYEIIKPFGLSHYQNKHELPSETNLKDIYDNLIDFYIKDKKSRDIFLEALEETGYDSSEMRKQGILVNEWHLKTLHLGAHHEMPLLDLITAPDQSISNLIDVCNYEIDTFLLKPEFQKLFSLRSEKDNLAQLEEIEFQNSFQEIEKIGQKYEYELTDYLHSYLLMNLTLNAINFDIKNVDLTEQEKEEGIRNIKTEFKQYLKAREIDPEFLENKALLEHLTDRNIGFGNSADGWDFNFIKKDGEEILQPIDSYELQKQSNEREENEINLTWEEAIITFLKDRQAIQSQTKNLIKTQAQNITKTDETLWIQQQLLENYRS